MNTRGFHVYAALEGSLGLEAIREALPAGTPLRAVPLAEAGRAGSEIQQGADLVIVGCSQSHAQALDVISAATAQRADRPALARLQQICGPEQRCPAKNPDDVIELLRLVEPVAEQRHRRDVTDAAMRS